jgi:hypothetical protein
MGHVPCLDVAKKISEYMKADMSPTTKPEVEGLWFYGMNHGMALVSARYAAYEPLPPEVLKFVHEYHKVLGPKAVRAFYYLLLICTRESRHVQGSKVFDEKLLKLFGGVASGFNASIRGKGSTTAYKAFLTSGSTPEMTLGGYVKSLQWIFYNGKFSSGFGGPAWGKVADCLVRFVTGEFTAEMMLDTIWTLCHNNGPIFNKGMLYQMYSPYLLRLLDVQRSGQIPEAVRSDLTLMPFVSSELSAHINWLCKTFPGKIGTYVDWYVVEALGAVNSYPHEKSAQIKKHGLSPKALEASKAEAEALAAEEAAELAATQKAAMTKAEWEKTHFAVMPGLDLEKFEPKRKAA